MPSPVLKQSLGWLGALTVSIVDFTYAVRSRLHLIRAGDSDSGSGPRRRVCQRPTTAGPRTA